MAAKKKAKAKAPSKARDPVEELLDGIRAETKDDGSAYVLGSDEVALKIRGVVSSQCPTLDAAIGRGGFPKGRLSILHGPEGCGKTTVALHAVAETQRQGGFAIYVDKEYKLDPDYATRIGVDSSRLLISQPGSLEDVLKIIDISVRHAATLRGRSGRRTPITVVVDSMNACLAKAVIEGKEGAHHIAPQARVWSEHLPKLIERTSREDVTLLFISQVRSKINVMFGEADDMAGGNAPRFYASLITKIRRVGSIKDEGEKVGIKCEAECRKNQIAPPFRRAAFNISYGRGIDFENALIQLLEREEIVTKKGPYLSLDGERLGQGYVEAAKVLEGERGEKLWREYREGREWD